MAVNIEQLEALIEPVVDRLGLVLYQVDLSKTQKRTTLHVVLERKEKKSPKDGITLDELTEANHEISAMLDLEDPIKEPYQLAVDSPGVERSLNNKRQYRFAIGENIRVTLRGAAGATPVSGRLTACDDDGISVETDGNVQKLSYVEIKHAQTVYAWEDASSKKRKF